MPQRVQPKAQKQMMVQRMAETWKFQYIGLADAMNLSR